jgi:hypothetical protein
MASFVLTTTEFDSIQAIYAYATYQIAFCPHIGRRASRHRRAKKSIVVRGDRVGVSGTKWHDRYESGPLYVVRRNDYHWTNLHNLRRPKAGEIAHENHAGFRVKIDGHAFVAVPFS